ncbi:ankyrin repeat-containing domain protein [Aspergillus carlsbadensis]|nr:ankyrin repeat-containing domain protein [Aspergillus carlsbadensis]
MSPRLEERAATLARRLTTAISGTASILKLLTAAITVTEAILALLRAISDAPRELQDIAIKVSIIQSQLQQLDVIRNNISLSKDRTLAPDFRRRIEVSLEKTRVANIKLQDAIRPLQTKSNLASRVHWTLLDRSKVAVLSQRLQGAEQNLSPSLRILETQISLSLKTAILRTQQGVDDLLANVRKVNENMTVSAPNHPLSEQSVHYYFHPSLWRGRTESSSYTAAGEPHSTCTIDIPLPLPCRGSRVLRFRFGVQHLPMFAVSWGFQLERVSLSVKRLVPDDSKIIRFCKGGDLVAVQMLLREGQASVNDATSLGLTPLMCAIESGRLDLVQFLIAAGADVNAQLDHCNTNILQLAAQYNHFGIFRHLLAENVDGDHIDSSGWPVAFYLESRLFAIREDRVAFLKLLRQYGGCDVAHQGPGNWIALHRAANFGTPSDISTLVRYGACISARAGLLGWAPIHYATIAGNTDVVKELAGPKYSIDVKVQDARG